MNPPRTYANNGRFARGARAGFFFLHDYVIGSVPSRGRPFREAGIFALRFGFIELGVYQFVQMIGGLL